jgi:hypothetical protein
MSSGASYKLKRFASSKSADFPSALLLYVRNTPANVRADTNEITYWLDNFQETFSDNFYVFGFYKNRLLIGYAQAAYFQTERIFALDYIALDEKHRANGAFHEFVDQLRDFMEVEHPEYYYGFAEVVSGSDEQDFESTKGHLLIRLFKHQGFRIIKAPYYQPRVMFDVPESEMKADLMIYSRDELKEISTETYLKIINTIYFKHYLRWKQIFPETQPQYRKYLETLYTKVKSGVGRNRTILINGHKAVLKTSAQKPVISIHRFISFSIQGLLIITLLAAAMLGLKVAFNLSIITLILIYFLSITSFMGVVGIVSKEAREIFGQTLELAKFVIDKQIGGSKPNETKKLPSPQNDLEKK